MTKPLKYQEVYRFHFAYEMENIRCVTGEILSSGMKHRKISEMGDFVQKLLATRTDSNVVYAGKFLLLMETPDRNLLELCLDCHRPSLRLDIVFALRKLGGVFFDPEIEEYILTQEHLPEILYMVNRYHSETGKGWSIYTKIIKEYRNTDKLSSIINSLAKTNLLEMCEVLLRLLPESGIPDFELLLALGALDESKAAGLLNDYLLENKEGNLCLKWIQTMNDSQLHGNRRSLLSISETLLKAAVFCEVDKKVWQLLYENAMLFPARTSFEILQNLSDGNLENAFLLELLETRLSRSCVDLTAIEGVSRFSDQTRRLFYLFLRDPLLQTRGELPSQHFEWSLYAPSNYQLLLEHHSGEGRFAMTPSKASLLLDHLNSSEMPEISGESLGLCYYYLLENGLLEREHLRRLFSRKENNTDVDIYLK